MSQLREFVRKVLEQEGAITEDLAHDGLEVLSSPEVQRALGFPELARLAFSFPPPQGAQLVTLEPDWMERLERLLGERGHVVRRVLNVAHTAPSDPERILEKALQLTNATWRLQGVRPAWTRYWILSFHYTATSDEKRDGVLQLGVNLSNGSIVEHQVDLLLNAFTPEASEEGTEHRAPDPLDLPAAWCPDRLQAVLQCALPARIERGLDRFLLRMYRRQGRDLNRVHQYHTELRQELLDRLAHLEARPDLSERQRSERSRVEAQLQAIDREYRAKVEDLRHKYAVYVENRWIQTIELIMPVQRFELSVLRRKRQRSLALDWNPLTRRLDTPACAYSYTWDRPRAVCDERLHLVTPAALGDCPHCGKAYCRACHDTCPKCNAYDETGRTTHTA